jgi:hypothetical protein
MLAPLDILHDVACRDRPDIPAFAQDCHQEQGAPLCVHTSPLRVIEKLTALSGIPFPQDTKRNRFLRGECSDTGRWLWWRPLAYRNICTVRLKQRGQELLREPFGLRLVAGVEGLAAAALLSRDIYCPVEHTPTSLLKEPDTAPKVRAHVPFRNRCHSVRFGW